MARINKPTLPVVTTLLCAVGMGAIISTGNAQSGSGGSGTGTTGAGQGTGTTGRDDTRAPGTSAGRGAGGAQSTPGMDQANMRAIAEAGMCASMCAMTAAHCLDLGGEHASRTHQTLLADCSDACGVTAALMSRGSPNAARMASTAAEIAEQCARECDRLANNDPMLTRCAEMCRRTATTLRAQGNTGTGTGTGTPSSGPGSGTGTGGGSGSGSGNGSGSGAGGSGTGTGRP